MVLIVWGVFSVRESTVVEPSSVPRRFLRLGFELATPLRAAPLFEGKGLRFNNDRAGV